MNISREELLSIYSQYYDAPDFVVASILGHLIPTEKFELEQIRIERISGAESVFRFKLQHLSHEIYGEGSIYKICFHGDQEIEILNPLMLRGEKELGSTTLEGA
jgi:hypothetical protein